MIQGDTEGQVDTHDPILGRARKVAIHDVRSHAEDPIDVQAHDCSDGEGNVSNFEAWQSAVLEEADDSRNKDESPGDDESDVEDAETIEVDFVGQGVSSCEGHDDDEVLEQRL